MKLVGSILVITGALMFMILLCAGCFMIHWIVGLFSISCIFIGIGGLIIKDEDKHFTYDNEG